MSTKPKPEVQPPNSDAVRAYYDKFSAERSVNYTHNSNPRIEKAVQRILPLVREDSYVLEIGCGAGFVTEQIARVATRGFVWACDISDSAVELARKRNQAPNVQFRALDVVARFGELNTWLTKSVDLVVMVDVLEHLPLSAHEKFFHDLATLTSPQSEIVLTFPSADYQRHLRQQCPEELQIIDEIIELPHVHHVATANGFAVKHFSLENVWFPNQYAHCILTRGEVDYADQNSIALSEIASLIRPGEKFMLADQDEWRQKAPPGRMAIPFLEREGSYWGAPADDDTAIRECTRLRETGAAYIVFGWPAFWWLEYYSAFHQHLLANSSCLLKNTRIAVFRFHR